MCKKNWQKCIPTFLQNLKVFSRQIFGQLLKYLSSFLLSKHTQLKICIYPLSVFLLPLFWSHSYWPTSTERYWHWCFFLKKERQQETLKNIFCSKAPAFSNVSSIIPQQPPRSPNLMVYVIQKLLECIFQTTLQLQIQYSCEF